MSHPTSKVEVTVDSASIVGALPDGSGGPFTGAAYGLMVFDPSTYRIEDVWYGVYCTLSTNGLNTAYTSVFYAAAATGDIGGRWTVSDVHDMQEWQSLDFVYGTSFVYTVVLNDGGAAFFNGGTLSITKDFDNNHIIFSCQGGAFTSPYIWDGNGSHPGLAVSAGPDLLLPSPGLSGIYHQLAWTHNAPTESIATAWKNFEFSKAGTQYFGCAMSSTDPGIWQTINVGFEDDVIPNSDTQLPTKYLTKWQATQPGSDDEEVFPKAQEARLFLSDTHGYGLASAMAPEHGTIFLAYAGPADLTEVRTNRTFDNGRSAQVATILAPGTNPVAGVGCAYGNGRLYVVWYDVLSLTLFQSISIDLGITWSTPMALSFTGSNPVILLDPNHGIIFYFYQDLPTGNIYLQRSGDAGATMIDTTPHTVLTGISPQTIAAEFGSDGTVVVAYVAAGVITQKRSRDYGLTWG